MFAKGDEGSTSRPAGGFRHFQVLAVNGLQNLWNGVSVRFAPQDFRGWPFCYDELERHYGAVEQRITVCGTREGLDDLPDGVFVAPKPLRPADRLIVRAVAGLGEPQARAIPNRKAVETRKGHAHSCISNGMCTSGCPVGSVYKFSTRLLPALRELPNYTLQTNAKVVRLLREPGTQDIAGVEYIDTTTRARHIVRAHRYVLAAGAVETPRILFNSEDGASPTGLCNSLGRVGIGLQDNPKVVLSTSLLAALEPAQRLRHRLWRSVDSDVAGPHARWIPISVYRPCHSRHTGCAALSRRHERFSGIHEGASRTDDVPQLCHLGTVLRRRSNPEKPRPPRRIKDRYGVRQVAVDFEVPTGAHHQMEAMMDWGRRVLRKASATMIYTSRDNSGTGIHYAGTTAMSDDPASGVVNRDLRAHDFNNLYICDGGVLPTLPDKHLTLTIMALANRLGEHLATQRY